MRISQLISSAESTSGLYIIVNGPDTAGRSAVNQLELQAEAGCIARCVGSSTAAACSYCGDDSACWDSCAGNGRGSCVANCYN